MIEITVSGMTREGKSAVASLITQYLRATGLNVFHDAGEDGPIPFHSLPGRLQRLHDLHAPITVVERNVKR